MYACYRYSISSLFRYGVFMKKSILFSEELEEVIQKFADEYMNGNFTMAVVFLCRTGLDNFTTNRGGE